MTTDTEVGFRSWNPLRGCSRISSGCENCYAERFAFRLSEPGQAYEGLVKMTASGPRWTGKIRLVPELLEEPHRWRKPSIVFVNSMSDVFHEDVPDSFIKDIFRAMRECYWHTFFIITKRARRMLDFSLVSKQEVAKNVWLGISVENQKAADERVPLLLQVPAALRFLCCEPLLGPVDLSPYLSGGIDWVITGPESGYGARPMDENWVRGLRDQCVSAGVRFCFKQRKLDGIIWDQSPDITIISPPKLRRRTRPSNQLEFDFGE